VENSALRCDVIMAHATPVVAALQHEKKSVPIVFVVMSELPASTGRACLRWRSDRIAVFFAAVR
jgi:hypothetical protein